MADKMLTTYDNPYNPFENFIIWLKFDLMLGHNTCGLLAKMTESSPAYSDSRNDELTDEVMDYIVSLAPTLYRKVSKEDFEKDKATIE